MKILIIGSGKQGSDMAKYLVGCSDVTEIKLTDIDRERAEETAASIKSDKISAGQIDASKKEEIVKAAKGVDIVVNAVIPLFNITIMEGALEAGANYVDLASGPPYENIDMQLGENSRWKDRGLTALINTGSSPGITSVLIACCADELDQVDEIKIVAGSRIRPGSQMIEGKQVMNETWSPVTLWEDMLAPPLVFENGKWKKVPPFSGEEVYEFPEPLGKCTVVDHIHEEVFTVPRFIGKGLKKMHLKFGFFPDYHIAKAVLDLGLWSDEPIEVKGVKVSPRDLVKRLLKPIPTTDEMIKKIEAGALLETVRASVVEVKGKKDGIETTFKCYREQGPYTSVYQAYEELGRSYFERPGLTGRAAAIFTHMLGRGEIKTKGVYPCECLLPEEREAFRKRLAEEGVVYKASVQKRII